MALNKKQSNKAGFKRKRREFVQVIQKRSDVMKKRIMEQCMRQNLDMLPQEYMPIVEDVAYRTYMAAERMAVMRAIHIVLMVLIDEFGFGAKRCNRVARRALDHYVCTISGHVTTRDIVEYVQEKTGGKRQKDGTVIGGIQIEIDDSSWDVINALEKFQSIVSKNVELVSLETEEE